MESHSFWKNFSQEKYFHMKLNGEILKINYKECNSSFIELLFFEVKKAYKLMKIPWKLVKWELKKLIHVQNAHSFITLKNK